MEDQVVHADKKLRRQVPMGFVVLVLVGAVVIQGISSHMENLEQMAGSDSKLAIEKLGHLLLTMKAVNAVVSVVFAVYFFNVARKTWRSERYPPPGMRVIQDTKIQEGGRAKLMALVHMFIAAVVFSTNLITWYLQLIFEKLVQK
jgi:hypothetical protein